MRAKREEVLSNTGRDLTRRTTVIETSVMVSSDRFRGFGDLERCHPEPILPWATVMCHCGAEAVWHPSHPQPWAGALHFSKIKVVPATVGA